MWRFVADRVKTGRSRLNDCNLTWIGRLNDRPLTRANEGNWPNPVHDDGPESTHTGHQLLSKADARACIASLKKNDGAEMEVVLIILKVEAGDVPDLLLVIVEYLAVVRVIS